MASSDAESHGPQPPEAAQPMRPESSRTGRAVRIVAGFFEWSGWPKVGSIATAIAAVAALWFSAQSLRSTENQYGLSEQGQITDRFSRSVESLGNESMSVRLGGIYALERLARDSPQDQPTIIEVLGAYVRTMTPPVNAPECATPTITPTDNPWPHIAGPIPQPIAEDVQAAVTVIGRRDTSKDGPNPPDLNRSCLSNVRLHGAFAGADLSGSKLFFAQLDGADLSCASMGAADLSFANFTGAHLRYADLMLANLQWATVRNVDMKGVVLLGATLESANLGGSDLTGANLVEADLTNTHLEGGTTLGGEVDAAAVLRDLKYTDETKWPVGYVPPPSTGSESPALSTADCLRTLSR
ncbi:pentapeptide repeat-containing protein [Rhodococcus sp. NPDC058481]|uniref:pentapeptide repeat-containing protein n=1 Tax=unclassified Rhodococcus (in: high G+C Gram-positive bacteria) TaxID=192944 RepID=UPI0036638DD9